MFFEPQHSYKSRYIFIVFYVATGLQYELHGIYNGLLSNESMSSTMVIE
jgi:hypothetical protein